MSKGTILYGADKFKAYLRVRRFNTREVIDSVGLSNLDERHVEKVMMGMLRNMDLDKYFIDDSEVDKARKRAAKRGKE